MGLSPFMVGLFVIENPSINITTMKLGMITRDNYQNGE